MKRATSFDADNRRQSSVPTIHDSFAYGEYQTPAGLCGAGLGEHAAALVHRTTPSVQASFSAGEVAPGGGTGDE